MSAELSPSELAEWKEALASYPGLLEHYRATVGLVQGRLLKRLVASSGLLARFAPLRGLDGADVEAIAVAMAAGHLVALGVYTGHLTAAMERS